MDERDISVICRNIQQADPVWYRGNPRGQGKGIHRYTFDAKTGTLYESTAPAPAENPSYLALSFDKQYLYAVNELKEYKSKAGGARERFIG